MFSDIYSIVFQSEKVNWNLVHVELVLKDEKIAHHEI